MKEIKIFAQGNNTFASLVDGKRVMELANASYNPNDAKKGLPYSFETGAKLALDRLFRKIKETEESKPLSKPFGWKTFAKGELAVHCETEIEAKRFLRACKKRGCLWLSGDDLSKYNYFHRYKEKTCYWCADYGCYPGKGIAYGNLNYHKSRNIEIVKYTTEVMEVINNQPQVQTIDILSLLPPKDEDSYYPDEYADGYAEGWNACIDKIVEMYGKQVD